MATWGRCWRKSKKYSSVFLADPWHQRDDRPVLRWVSPASAPGARRRLPWCLCCSPWKPDRGLKQDHRKGWSFVAHAYRWLFYLWGNNEITLLNERNANSRGCIPQTLNMTNRWKKTSEDVQAISAPKVNPKYCISSLSNLSTKTFSFQDLSCFLSCITIPDFVPITKHNFLPPPMKDQGNVSFKIRPNLILILWWIWQSCQNMRGNLIQFEVKANATDAHFTQTFKQTLDLLIFITPSCLSSKIDRFETIAQISF